jgi:oligopeptide transport system substrate-binding protein
VFRRQRCVALVIAAALVVGACTGGSGSTAGKARRGGTLRIGVTADSSLDPAQARTVEQLLVADQLFDGLTAYDAWTNKVVPALAARWAASDDQKTWDFTLRPGITFANGRAITADDVKYTFDRIARRGSGSPGAELLEPVSGYADTAVRDAPGLAGISAPQPDLVRISLDAPFAVLPALLSAPVFGVVPRESVEAATPAFAKGPIGSGPFTVKDRTGTRIHLVRAPGSKALLDAIDLVGYDGIPAAYTAFTQGDLDWTQVPPEKVAAARQEYGSKGFVPYAAELLFGFNLKNSKFADVRFRQAIVKGIDRRALVRAVYDDIFKRLDGVVVSGVPGFNNDLCGELCAHDVAAAKALVAEVFPSGAPEIFLDYDAGEIRDALAKAIQADLNEIGVNATLRPKPFDEYLNFEVSGQQEMFLLGWIGRYPSQEDFLAPLFASGSRNNLVGLKDNAFDKALAAARAEPDEAKRLALYRDAEKAALALLPVVPILQYQVHSVTAKRVGGLRLSPTGTFDGAKVWLGG